MRIACWMPKATNTLKICNNYGFSITAVVARTRLTVSLVCVHLLISLSLYMTKTIHPTANMNAGYTHVQANGLP
jgi:hypothetical protein